MLKPATSSLEHAARRLARLPGRPSLYLDVARLIGERNVTTNAVARAIRGDAAATAALLRLANSPLYYRSRHVGTVADAITTIGLEGVKALLMTVYYAALQRESPGMDWWARERHGVASAVAARALGSEIRPSDPGFPERCYVAGLLHDVGQLGLFPSTARAVSIASDPLAVEQALHGYDHAALGAAVAHHWNLPLSVCDAIRDHHAPTTESADPPLTAAVHLAALAADRVITGRSGEPDPGALALAGFSGDDFVAWCERVHGVLDGAEEWSRASEVDPGAAAAEVAGIPAVRPPEFHVEVYTPNPEARMPAGM